VANVRRGKKAPQHIVSSTTPFKEAVRFACLQLYRTDDQKWRTKLEGIALKLTDLALSGDLSAIREVGLQLDGRLPTINIDNSTTNVTVGAAISELMARRNRAVDAVEVTVNETPQMAIESVCEEGEG
jgi:hypothetical protein